MSVMCLTKVLVSQLCDGASPEERQVWRLGQAKEFHYLNQSSCYQLKDVDNAAEYKVLLPRCFGFFP